jgi:putative ABC transport system ATP-binding protein
MQRLNEQTGTAFIFATHDPRVMKFARRTIHLVDGRVAENNVATKVANAL